MIKKMGTHKRYTPEPVYSCYAWMGSPKVKPWPKGPPTLCIPKAPFKNSEPTTITNEDPTGTSHVARVPKIPPSRSSTRGCTIIGLKGPLQDDFEPDSPDAQRE